MQARANPQLRINQEEEDARSSRNIKNIFYKKQVDQNLPVIFLGVFLKYFSSSMPIKSSNFTCELFSLIGLEDTGLLELNMGKSYWENIDNPS